MNLSQLFYHTMQLNCWSSYLLTVPLHIGFHHLCFVIFNIIFVFVPIRLWMFPTHSICNIHPLSYALNIVRVCFRFTITYIIAIVYSCFTLLSILLVFYMNNHYDSFDNLECVSVSSLHTLFHNVYSSPFRNIFTWMTKLKNANHIRRQQTYKIQK